jgi:hypothetical protein
MGVKLKMVKLFTNIPPFYPKPIKPFPNPYHPFPRPHPNVNPFPRWIQNPKIYRRSLQPISFEIRMENL